MTALFDRLLDTLVPSTVAGADCTADHNIRYGPCYDYFFTRRRLVSDCFRRTNCQTYCSYFFQTC